MTLLRHELHIIPATITRPQLISRVPVYDELPDHAEVGAAAILDSTGLTYAWIGPGGWIPWPNPGDKPKPVELDLAAIAAACEQFLEAWRDEFENSDQHFGPAIQRLRQAVGADGLTVGQRRA